MNSYKITLSKTANGQQEYLQIISADGFAVNVVLVGKFELHDTREPEYEESDEPFGFYDYFNDVLYRGEGASEQARKAEAGGNRIVPLFEQALKPLPEYEKESGDAIR